MSTNKAKTHWLHRPSGIFGGKLAIPLGGIYLIMVALFACNFLLLAFPDLKVLVVSLDFLILTSGTILVLWTNKKIENELLTPLTQIRNWAYAIQDGDLTARLPLPDSGEYLRLAIVINDLGDSIYALSQEMDEKVKQQTHRLHQKTKTLEILYEVAATSASEQNPEDLLQNYLYTIFNLVKASAATARILTDDNKFKVIGSIGVDDYPDFCEIFLEGAANGLYNRVASLRVVRNEAQFRKSPKSFFAGNELGDNPPWRKEAVLQQGE